MKRCNIYTLFLVLLFIVTLFSCSGDTPQIRGKYTVKFLSEGTEFYRTEVYSGDYVTLPEANPEKEGCTFRGWYSNGTEYDTDSKVTGDLTLHAYFTDSTKAQVRVIYGEGTGIESVEYITLNEDYIIPAASSRDGYTFKIWKINDTEYNSGATVKISCDTVITAIYERITVTVTFLDKEGNPIEGATKSVPWGTVITPPQITADKGYQLLSWDDTNNTVVTMGNNPFVAKNNATLHPAFKELASAYTVTYDYGDGTTTESGISYGGKAHSPNVFKNGHELEYWYKDDEYTKFDFEENTITSDITLHAKWKEIEGETITLTLKSTEHHEFNEVITLKKGSNYDMYFMEGTFVLPDTEGEEFIITSWNGDDGSSIDNDNLQLYQVSKDIVYTAIWEKRSYEVRYNLNGGTYKDSNGNEKYDIEKEKVEFNSRISEPEVVLTRTGYVFGGWSSDEKNKYDFNAPVTKKITLTALWEPTECNLTINYCDNVTTDTVTPIPYDTEFEDIPLKTPSRSGFSFVGWYDSQTEGNEIAPRKTISDDLTIYARWEETETYTLSYYDALGETLLYTETVNVGDKAMGYSAPKIDGTVFKGWYENTDSTVLCFAKESYDFSKPVSQNVKLRAGYTPDENYFDGTWNYATGVSFEFINSSLRFTHLGDEGAKSALGKWNYSEGTLTLSVTGTAALNMGGIRTPEGAYNLQENGTRSMYYSSYIEGSGNMMVRYTLYRTSSSSPTWEGGHGRWKDSVTVTESSLKDLRKYVLDDKTYAEVTVSMKNTDWSDAECVLKSYLVVPVTSDKLIITGIFGGYQGDEIILTRIN